MYDAPRHCLTGAVAWTAAAEGAAADQALATAAAEAAFGSDDSVSETEFEERDGEGWLKRIQKTSISAANLRPFGKFRYPWDTNSASIHLHSGG